MQQSEFIIALSLLWGAQIDHIAECHSAFGWWQQHQRTLEQHKNSEKSPKFWSPARNARANRKQRGCSDRAQSIGERPNVPCLNTSYSATKITAPTTLATIHGWIHFAVESCCARAHLDTAIFWLSFFEISLWLLNIHKYARCAPFCCLWQQLRKNSRIEIYIKYFEENKIFLRSHNIYYFSLYFQSN